MAAPVPTSTNNSQEALPVTSHTVALPPTRPVGEKICCSFVSVGGAVVVVTFPAGWTVLGLGGLGGSGGVHHVVAERVIDGTEGNTITVTTDLSVESCHYTEAGPYGEVFAQLTPNTANNNSPIFPTVNVPSGDYRILAAVGTEGSPNLGSPPSGYAQLVNQNTGSGNACSQGVYTVDRLGITSETPGGMTLGSGERWATFTVAIPAAAGGGEFQVAWAIGSNVLIQ